eukprot:symbB.v1.2.010420.t1/scaffold655.1/size176010/7
MARNIKRYRRERERQEQVAEDLNGSAKKKGQSEPNLAAPDRLPPEWVPATYSLPNDYAIFVEEFRKSPNSTWIAKPTGKAQGRGIFLVSKLNQLKRWSNPAQKEKNQQGQPLPFREPYIISRYISNPLLVGGKKFDMRLYVLVTNYKPLKVCDVTSALRCTPVPPDDAKVRHNSSQNMEQLAPPLDCKKLSKCFESCLIMLAVFFVAQSVCPKVLQGIVPDSILSFMPLILTGLTFLILKQVSDARTAAASAALIGQEAPDFEIQDESGSQSLKEFLQKNKKPTVIDFYQNFCPACVPAAKQIEELAGDAKYKDKVKFMLVNLGSLEEAQKYAKERELPGNAWHGTGKPHDDYGLK